MKEVQLSLSFFFSQHRSSLVYVKPNSPYLQHTHSLKHTHAVFIGEGEGGVNKQYKMRLHVQPAAVTTETITTQESFQRFILYKRDRI